MIKVLHVIGKRPRGGVGTFLINMNKHLNIDEFTFDYLICDKDKTSNGFDIEVRKFGAEVFVLPELKYINLPKYFLELSDFYKSHHNYDIVHVHSPNIGFFNYFFARKYGIKHRILHSHNTMYSDKIFNSVRNYLLQLPLKFYYTSMVACSIKASNFLFGKKAYISKKVFLAKNAIDIYKFKYNEQVRYSMRRDLNIENNFVVGHIGRFNKQKNHLFLLNIFCELLKIDNSSILILVGDGELIENIKEKAKDFNILDKVIFLGQRQDIPDLLQVFDVFVLPSIFEGLPLVGIEVQAAGVPCVMSKNITNEIKVTELVEFLSLNESALSWAKKIASFKKHIRKDTYFDLINSGYEEKQASQNLQLYYSSIIHKNK